MKKTNNFDVVIIGGGFYGCSIAIELKKSFSKVLLIEKDMKLFNRSSSKNQARIHNGYHYPRHFNTASSSHKNFYNFSNDFKQSVVDNFTKLYAIPKIKSNINSFQFYNFFRQVGSPIKVADDKYKVFFNDNLIDEVFEVEEFVFDYKKLKKIIQYSLDENKIDVKLNTEVIKIDENLNLKLSNGEIYNSKYVFNCTYSGINKLLKASNLNLLPLKHELTEMALLDVPEQFKNIGLTVMDGPFFSLMPYPTKQKHTLSHVVYTPHFAWQDNEENFIFNGIENEKVNSNFKFMINDAKRYLPLISESKYLDSIYEIKTVLIENEIDDGRPILFNKDYGYKNFYNILGGKIDNIYDVINKIKGCF